MKRTWLWIVITFVLGELACFTMDAKFVLLMGIGLILVLLLCIKIRPIFCVYLKYRYRIILLTSIFLLGGLRLFWDYKPMEYQSGDVYFEFRVEKIKMGKNSAQFFSENSLIFYRIDEMDEKIHVGDVILVKGKYKKVHRASNPGEFDAYLYYKSLNIERVLYAKEIVVAEQKHGLSDFVFQIRQRGNAAIQSIFDEKDSGFLQAILFGEKSELDEELNENFRDMGVSHLLTISGLHVSILGLSLYHIFRKHVKLGFLPSGIISGAFLWFYAILVGNNVSVIRAASMLLTVFIADILGRSYDMLSSASITAFFILLFSPFQLFNGGFLLSFGAIFSISIPSMAMIKAFGLHKKDCKCKWFSSVIVSVSIFLFTLPIILYFYFGFSPYSLFLNLLFIPLMSLVLYSGLVATLLSFISVGFAGIAGGLAHSIILFMDYMVAGVRKLPFSFLIIGRPALWQVFLYYILLSTIFIWLMKQKERSKRVCYSPIVLMICVGLILMLRPIFFYTNISILDVGQGDGILIQTRGRNILIDCGSTTKKDSGKRILVPALMSMGIYRVDHVFMTHRDIDHVNGIEWLLQSGIIQIKNIYLSKFMVADVFVKEALPSLAEVLENYSDQLHIISDGFYLDIKGTKLYCLSPREEGTYSNANEASLVLAFVEGEFSALFMGDAGKETEEKLLDEYGEKIKDFSMLKVGHHGSATASSKEFIATTNPKYAMISYGENNRYHHPRQEVLDCLHEFDVQTLETAIHGAIQIETDGMGIRVKSMRME